MAKSNAEIIESVVNESMPVILDTIDLIFSKLADQLKTAMADAYDFGQSIDGQPWMGNEQSTTRWRRHYIAKGSYKRVSRQVPILGVDEDDVMILSGITRDKVIDSIYYDTTTGDVIIPDNSTINKFFDSDTTTIILNNLDRKPIFPDNAETFLDVYYDIAEEEILKIISGQTKNIIAEAVRK